MQLDQGAGLVNLSRNNLCRGAVNIKEGRNLFCTSTVNCWDALCEGVSLYIQLLSSALAESTAHHWAFYLVNIHLPYLPAGSNKEL